MQKNNRSLTLDGLNQVFRIVGIYIEKHELGYYYANYKNTEVRGKTLIDVSQALINKLSKNNNP